MLSRIAPGMNRAAALFMLYSALKFISMFGMGDAILNFYFVSLGYENDSIGVLQAVFRLGGLLTGVPVGLLANRVGIRRLVIWSMVAGGAMYPLLLISPEFVVLAANRFILGVFFGAAFIATAPLLVSLGDAKYHTHLFSYYNIITMGSSAVGSFIGGFMPGVIGALFGVGEQSPFAYGGTLVIVGVIYALSALPLMQLRDAPRTDEQPAAPGPPGLDWRPWLHLIWLSVPFMLFGFTAGLTFPFYNLFFRQTFGITDEAVGTILSLGWIGMALITLANPWLDAQFGRVRAIGVTMTVAALAFLGLSFAPGLILSTVVYVIATSVRNTLSPLFQPLMMASLPVALHNNVSSVSFVLWSLGWFIASALAGFWERAYGFGFIFQVVAFVLLLTGGSVVVIYRQAISQQVAAEN